MLRFAAFILSGLMMTLSVAAAPTAGLEPGDLASVNAVLMDADTGQALYSKAMHERAYPASITKIMTGLLAMESDLSADEILTVSAAAVRIPRSSTSIDLSAGEEITVGDAMYAMMLPSANDAANVLAEGVSGSLAAFSRLMNERAIELGAKGTSFANASGLPRRNLHYTTAYDMALITRAAIQNSRFMTYFGAERRVMPATNLYTAERNLRNSHYMLRSDTGYYNPEVIAGKVGYTNQSRHTMSTVAVRDGRTLICVVMGCSSEQKYSDTSALLEHGFTAYESVTVSDAPAVEKRPIRDADGKNVGEVAFSTGGEWELLLPEGMTGGDVEISYSIPASFANRDSIKAIAVIRPKEQKQPPEGIPEAFLEEPLTYSVTMYQPADEEPPPVSAVPAMAPIEDAPQPTNERGFPWVAVALAVIIPAVVGVIVWRKRKRRSS
jgi:D-alanyl-D-alanine carboxypeptidase